MKPVFRDACNHDRPRDRFLGTVKGDGHLYDVYVYQDNALTVTIPDMNLCMRYGVEGGQYISPGSVDDFVVIVRGPLRTLDGRLVVWPESYVRVADLIEKWIDEGRP